MNSNKLIILLLLLPLSVYGQMTGEDSLYLARSMHAVDSAMQNRKLINRIANYYDRAVNDTSYRFDMTFGGAPYYKTSTSLGIGGIATGLYRTDSVSRRSDLNIIGKVTLTGFYSLETKGNHNCLNDLLRISYQMDFRSFPQLYWGQGFHNGDTDSTRTEMTRKSFHILVKPGIKIARNFYGGPVVSYDWVLGKNFKSDSLLGGASKRLSALNIGAFLTYDSRDVAYNAYKGLYLSIEQRDYINFGNCPFFKTIGDFRFYTPVWKDGILAFRAYGEFSYGNVPWTMVAKGDGGTIGSTVLRSYYEGRYEDDNLISATLELRQRIWKRLGAVAWIGGGNFFSKREPFSWDHTLSDIGLGLRWEFKRRVNIRIDYGFGRCGQSALILGINEAF